MFANHWKLHAAGIEVWDNIRRAFAEFLLVPTCIILVFLLLAVGSYILDRSESLVAFRGFLQNHIFADPNATSDLLGTIVGSIVTVTSLTVTLLLIVVQQTAATLSTQVFDSVR